jgi:hypothetical protein
MIQIVALFLLVMLLLGFGSRLRHLLGGGGKGGRNKLDKPRKCSKCGRFIVGKGRCDCGQS